MDIVIHSCKTLYAGIPGKLRTGNSGSIRTHYAGTSTNVTLHYSLAKPSSFPLVCGRFVTLKIGKKCKVKAISVFVNYDK